MSIAVTVKEKRKTHDRGYRIFCKVMSGASFEETAASFGLGKSTTAAIFRRYVEKSTGQKYNGFLRANRSKMVKLRGQAKTGLYWQKISESKQLLEMYGDEMVKSARYHRWNYRKEPYDLSTREYCEFMVECGWQPKTEKPWQKLSLSRIDKNLPYQLGNIRVARRDEYVVTG